MIKHYSYFSCLEKAYNETLIFGLAEMLLGRNGCSVGKMAGASYSMAGDSQFAAVRWTNTFTSTDRTLYCYTAMDYPHENWIDTRLLDFLNSGGFTTEPGLLR